MDFTFQMHVLLPMGLGLLGFVEPCTIGGHLYFLGTQEYRSRADKLKAVFIFVLVRTFVAGLFGALIAFVGAYIISFQTSVWLGFGALYGGIGVLYLVGQSSIIKKKIDLAPTTWKQARNPIVLGAAFGLNIPACAAPILFALLGLASTTKTVLSGFWMMALFGLFLSLPLVFFAYNHRATFWLNTLANKLKQRRWIIGVVFIFLGAWSVWFGLYVNPADWAGL